MVNRYRSSSRDEKASFVGGLGAHLLGALLSKVKEWIASVLICFHPWLKVFPTDCLRLRLLALSLTLFSSMAASGEMIQLIRTPDGGLQPQVAIDSRGNLHLVYLKGDPKACDVFYSIRKAGETAFSAPLKVNSDTGSAIAVGTVRGAQLALGRNARVHVVWNGSQPAREPGAKGCPMLYARLDDRDWHFEPQRNLMTSTMNLDGGGSVAADPRGNVYVVWHAHSRTGPDDETHRAVYVAHSTDDGATFTPERKVNSGESGVCGCCGLKASADDRGGLAILYRSADDLGNRDSMLLVSQDCGTTFQSMLLGSWRSSTCPMSTPALGPGPDHNLIAMWETQGQVYRRSINVKSPGDSSPELAADENPGDRKHPVFAVNHAGGSRLLMAWVEGTGWEKGGSLAWECVDLNTSKHTFGRQPGVPPWGMVAAAPHPDGSFTILY